MPTADRPSDVPPAGGRSFETSSAQQADLFDTSPPPWELVEAAKSAVAQVAFRDAPHGPYDYAIPDSMRGRLSPGARVSVPLGRRKRPTTGWCVGVDLAGSSNHKLRPITELIDDPPL